MRNKTILAAAIGALALFATGCRLPDYQVTFQITGTTNGPGYVDINYSMANVGHRGVTNAMIQIEYSMNMAAGGTVPYSEWTMGVSISVGMTHTGYLRHYLNASFNETILASTPVIAGAGWDTNE